MPECFSSSMRAATLSLLGCIVLLGCAVPYDFHTGRTLPAGRTALTMRLDDIYVGSRKDELSSDSSDIEVVSPGHSELRPGVALDFGLPARLETDLVYTVQRHLEGGLRWQVNPRRQTPFDLAVGLFYVHEVSSWSYLRSIATISLPIHGFEPYVHAQYYHFLDSWPSDGRWTEDRNLGAGISIPLGSSVDALRLMPELNYSFGASRVSKGTWQFGLAFKIPTRGE